SDPEDFLGEWEYRLTLPAYEIAEIQAFAIRDFDNKRSAASNTMNVLRYVAPDWSVKWAVVASYYYQLIDRQAIADKIGKIAEDNGFPQEVCFDGEPCYGHIDKDINLLLWMPKQAGEIGKADSERIHEEYGNYNDYPLALDF